MYWGIDDPPTLFYKQTGIWHFLAFASNAFLLSFHQHREKMSVTKFVFINIA